MATTNPSTISIMPVKHIRNAYEAALTMTAVLLSYSLALWLEDAAALHTDVLVLAVALTLTLARTQRTADARGRLMACVLLPALAGAATLLGHLIADHYAVGAAVFTLAISLPIWIRRFVPGPALPPGAQNALVNWGWSAVIGLLACGCVWLVQMSADRLGPWHPDPEPDRPRRASRLRPVPSTRMAWQMAAAVAAAFTLGRILFDHHWPWMVLTVYVVASGNRGRADVIRKGAERLVGACAGTLLATAVAAAGITGRTSVVLIFAVLAVALWLRPLNHAYWAAGMTTALSLLLGYFGQDAQDLLPTRLEAIAVGAVLAIASACCVLPIPRRRTPAPSPA
jgi:hypothetical protein